MIDWLQTAPPTPDEQSLKAAQQRQAELTKPPGSLGQLEQIALRLAALQATEQPQIRQVQVSLFAGDHGIAKEGVSAFPQAVTGQMLKNFIDGGAAANVLSRFIHAKLEVIDMGVANPVNDRRLRSASAGLGTSNFLQQPAMTDAQLAHCLNSGRQAAIRAKQPGTLFIGGEMGIANTTSATAVACALLNVKASQLTGAGTGISSKQIQHKQHIIQRALDKYTLAGEKPLTILKTLGGFEIVALAGAYISAAQSGIPVLIDGFICTASALAAIKINPAIKPWLFFSHCSDEQGHQYLLQALDVQPLLNLKMRLGEASGALAAVPLMQMACQLHNNMATFSEAEISQ
jgi:nicotinate-nucleotide--dimethylbenzimidazole phosphoribosyltransferase